MPTPNPQTPIPNSKSSRIAQVVVGLPVEGPFDYLVPVSLADKVKVGSRVFVPFAHRQLVGFVIGIKGKSSFRQLKPIFMVLDNTPSLDANALGLAKKFSEYYACSLGEALEAILPEALRKKREWTSAIPKLSDPALKFSPEQWLCHDAGRKQFWTFILPKIQETLDRGRQVIILVPEVHSILAVEEQIEKNLKVPFAVLDKKLTSVKELEQWQLVQEAKVNIVIGTRSAVFAPFQKLGLIVMIDEENAAYKQEQSPFYQTHEVARMRGEGEQASLIFVSVCPSVETFREFQKRPAQFIEFPPQRVADLQLIDLTNYRQKPKGGLSFLLQNGIQQVLAQGGRVVLFFNRRGFATITRCNQCAFVIQCPRCEVNLVYQYQKKKLACPLCAQESDLPKICPQCNSSYLRSTGAGVEKVESEAARFFPQARVAFFDRETENIPTEANIIVATQAVTRVLDAIQPELIAVLDFDGQMNRSDFRSSHRAFALLVQFSQAAKTKLVVQTSDPHSYCLKALRKMDFKSFYKKELALRRELGFPPFNHLVALTVRGMKKDAVQEHAQKIFEAMRSGTPAGIEIFDLQPDYVPKLRDKYRFTIMLKSRNVKKMLPWLKGVLHGVKRSGGVVVTVNVDP